jgi:endonuclease/exonuclease/phosphatase family metal-dependent hydrolase
MKKTLLVFMGILIMVSAVLLQSKSAETTLKAMSYNIRYNNPGDGVNAWPNRKDQVADLIGKQYKPDTIGLQEALIGQIRDLQERLPEYTWFGVGRDDGIESGEFMAIFYRKDRLELLQDSTFWLSETPHVPGSSSWNSACNRCVTWAKFRDKKTDKIFYHFNTHFDHRSEAARTESAKLIRRTIPMIAKDSPYILTGDFNFRETSDGYAILTGKKSIPETDFKLYDARYSSKSGHEGPTSTSARNGWTTTGQPETKIDYIFTDNVHTAVLKHKVLVEKHDGRHLSDHLPVLIQFIMK